MDWEQASQLMDDTVDDTLGDTISYAANGVSFSEIRGFVIFFGAPPVLDGIDEIIGSRPRAKIAKSKVPYPDPSHRLRCPKRLGPHTFKPAGALPEEQGRYYIFDLERA